MYCNTSVVCIKILFCVYNNMRYYYVSVYKQVPGTRNYY